MKTRKVEIALGVITLICLIIIARPIPEQSTTALEFLVKAGETELLKAHEIQSINNPSTINAGALHSLQDEKIQLILRAKRYLEAAEEISIQFEPRNEIPNKTRKKLLELNLKLEEYI
ncbi:hypothetical protein ACFL2R_02975 [Patescibacteria group bacterium]